MVKHSGASENANIMRAIRLKSKEKSQSKKTIDSSP